MPDERWWTWYEWDESRQAPSFVCTAYDHDGDLGILVQYDGVKKRTHRGKTIDPIVREILRLHEVELKAIAKDRG